MGILLFIVLFVGTMLISAIKGKPVVALMGLGYLGPLWLGGIPLPVSGFRLGVPLSLLILLVFFAPVFGALRLAKPDSWWARRFYEANERKITEARQRSESGRRPRMKRGCLSLALGSFVGLLTGGYVGALIADIQSTASEEYVGYIGELFSPRTSDQIGGAMIGGVIGGVVGLILVAIYTHRRRAADNRYDD